MSIVAHAGAAIPLTSKIGDWALPDAPSIAETPPGFERRRR